jgi:hypothetical protein
MGKLGLAGEIQDPQAKIELRPAASSKAVEDRTDQIHRVVALACISHRLRIIESKA